MILKETIEITDSENSAIRKVDLELSHTKKTIELDVGVWDGRSAKIVIEIEDKAIRLKGINIEDGEESQEVDHLFSMRFDTDWGGILESMTGENSAWAHYSKKGGE